MSWTGRQEPYHIKLCTPCWDLSLYFKSKGKLLKWKGLHWASMLLGNTFLISPFMGMKGMKLHTISRGEEQRSNVQTALFPNQKEVLHIFAGQGRIRHKEECEWATEGCETLIRNARVLMGCHYRTPNIFWLLHSWEP